ncbi:MAG: efflux transporter outer membrane subunit [Thermodesulfobacteriota bacterium]|nr:efflux transporter outer membrane subunit [Thermodesulfobacteriota bacterium]
MMVFEMRKLVNIVAIMIIVSFTGCAVGPDFKKPVVETPHNFRFSDSESKEVVNLKWWELFNDPVLNSLVITALNDNKDVRIAASRIEEARASLGFTKADMYPRLDVEAGSSRGSYIGGSKVDIDNKFFIAPTLSWEIDFWGKFRRATESARAELMGSEYSLRTVQISLISEVVSTYFLLLDYHQRLKISKQTLDSRLDSLDIIQKRFDKGIIPEIDLNQAQIQKEIAAAAIPVHERLIFKAENTLSILLGKFPGEIKRGADLYCQALPPDIPVGLPSSLLERRPDIIQALYLLEAQTARIGVAQALRFPSISLTGIFGFASTQLSDLISDGDAWSIGGSLFGPIFNFNQDKLRVEVEKERTKQALYHYENTVLFAFRDVANGLNEIHTYKKQFSAVEREFIAAKNANTLSKMRYDKGVTSYLEVLDTERTLFDVGLELSELKQQFYNAYVKLYKALGGGWLYKEEMEQAQNQPEAPKNNSLY